MFREKCNHCGKSVKKDYDFCPHCGFNLAKAREEREYGLLGKEDIENSERRFEQSFRISGGINIGEIFNTVNSLMNELTRNLDGNEGFPRGININLSCKKPTSPIKESPKKSIGFSGFSDEKIKEYSKLPKTEPKTDIRRLSKKMLYELEMPDVKGINDIMVSKLENSVEIRAVGKKMAYFKIIPLELELLKYDFEDGKLILEFRD